MVTYDSAAIYIEAATTLQDKITAVDAVIAALMGAALKGAATGQFSEYWLDDGQTKIQTKYRSMADVERSITAFIRIKNIYINQMTGRVVRLVDGKNFTGCL